MSKFKLVAKISQEEDNNIIGRIGGNIPEILLNSFSDIGDYEFYLTIRVPNSMSEYLSILVPKDFSRRIKHNIYPDCDIKVIKHQASDESESNDNTNMGINPASIVGYFREKSNNFITVHHRPELIQEEEYYYLELEKSGYSFMMQIDEDFYPKNLLSGSYLFAYGALYLYKHIETEEIIAGFWQYS